MAVVVALGCSCDNSKGGDGGTGGGGGGSGGSWVPSGRPLPLDELGDAFKTVVCQYYLECSDSGYLSMEQCKADREASGLKDVQDGVAEGRITYDPMDVGTCRDLFEADICNMPFILVPSVSKALDLCLSAVGHQQDGEPCRHDLECDSGMQCVMQDRVCPGVCTPYLEEGVTDWLKHYNLTSPSLTGLSASRVTVRR